MSAVACALEAKGYSDRGSSACRLDATERLDLKCGKGSISEGEKCSKGSAQKAQPTLRDLRNDPYGMNKEFWETPGSTKGIGNKIKRAGEFAANSGAALAIFAGATQIAEGVTAGNIGLISRGLRNTSLGVSATSLAGASRAARQGNKKLSKEFAIEAGKIAAFGVGQEAALGAASGFKRAGGVSNVKRGARRMYQAARVRASGARVMKRDSVYAAGFSPELDQLAI